MAAAVHRVRVAEPDVWVCEPELPAEAGVSIRPGCRPERQDRKGLHEAHREGGIESEDFVEARGHDGFELFIVVAIFDLSFSMRVGSDDGIVVVVVAPRLGLPVAEVDPFIDAEVELFAPTLALGFDVLSLLVDGVVGAV